MPSAGNRLIADTGRAAHQAKLHVQFRVGDVLRKKVGHFRLNLDAYLAPVVVLTCQLDVVDATGQASLLFASLPVQYKKAAFYQTRPGSSLGSASYQQDGVAAADADENAFALLNRVNGLH